VNAISLYTRAIVWYSNMCFDAQHASKFSRVNMVSRAQESGYLKTVLS